MNDHLDEASGVTAHSPAGRGDTAGTDGNDTTIGAPSAGFYGSEVAPLPPVEDMWAVDVIAGTFSPQERSTPPGAFTGGTGMPESAGLGGRALPPYPGGSTDPQVLPHTVYERRGF